MISILFAKWQDCDYLYMFQKGKSNSPWKTHKILIHCCLFVHVEDDILYYCLKKRQKLKCFLFLFAYETSFMHALLNLSSVGHGFRI